MQFYHMYGFVWPPRDAEPFHHMDPLWFPFIAAVISFCNPKPQPLAATKLFSISLILSFQECYINGIIQYIYTTFWDWLFSLSIMPLKCIQVVASVSSLCLYCLGVFHGVGVPWFFTSHLLKDISVVFSFGPLLIKLLWTFMYRFLCEHKFHFSGISAQKSSCWVVW